MDLLEVAMVSLSSSKELGVRDLSGLINFTMMILSVAIVATYLGTPAARIYTKFWKVGLNGWKRVIGRWTKTALSVVLTSLRRLTLKSTGENILFLGEIV
jgi:hypothetical protein